MKNKIRFPKQSVNDFYQTLQVRVQSKMKQHNLLERAKRELWLKFAIYWAVFIGSYFLLLFMQWQNTFLIALNYVIVGLSGILLAFNTAHDAAHGTLCKSKKWNEVLFRITFNLQGVNSYLWKKRHIASHHLFPNVDGCDADIDENALLRLSPTHKRRKLHKFQHIYASFLYLFYTLHWIFIKDIGYLTKKNLSNLREIKHPWIEYARFFLWKTIYFCLLIGLPVFSGYDSKTVVISFLIMHACISLVFVWTLIVSHLTLETAFPTVDKKGMLPFNYYEHQLATSMDYHPRSGLVNSLVGGFNAHAAHHLFPKLPHTVYRHITFVIQRTAAEFKVPYHSKTFISALQSHYAYLKHMGKYVESK